jgi:ribosomal protein S18 acetylase RimI-like enzyme
VSGTQPDGGPGWQLRPARPDDADALRAFLTGLSLRSRYLRFFAGALPVTASFLGRMTGGVTARGEVVDALLVTEAGPCPDREIVIGHGMSTDTRDDAGRPVTELAVVVSDQRRGQGAGSALIRALTARAQARGATALLLDVLAENRVMLALIAHYFPAAGYTRTGPYTTVTVQLPSFQEEPAREPAIGLSPGHHPGSVPGPRRGGAPADLPVG